MAPQERRSALIEATLPLMREFGPTVSTRQIADAAGVAEGTIFGVFPDKASLLRATAVRAMDPVETIAAIDGIDRSLELRARLERATGVLLERMAGNVALMTSLHRSGVFAPPRMADRAAPSTSMARRAEVLEARERVVDAVVRSSVGTPETTAPSPAVTVNLLVSIAFVAGRGGFGFTTPVSSPHEIVSLLFGRASPLPDPLWTRRPDSYHSEEPC